MLHDRSADDSSTERGDDEQDCVDADHPSKFVAKIHVFDTCWTKSERASCAQSLKISSDKNIGISLTDSTAKTGYSRHESAKYEHWSSSDEVACCH